jgi:flagellar hook protein FlgE
MFPAFSIALSALTADSSAINVVGNNLANLNTIGFKASDVGFHDLISQSLGVGASNGQVGMGIGQLSSVQNFTQGALTTTGGPTDAAIQGGGFFVIQGQSGETLYTRAGNFQMDGAGNLVTSTGENVQGWQAQGGVVNPNGPVTNLVIPLGNLTAPKATDTISMGVNLNAAAVVGSTDGTFAASVQVHDSLGESHNVTVTFTETKAGNWTYTATIPAAETTAATNVLATGTMTFDSSGVMTSATTPISLKATKLTDGAADLTMNWNLLDNNSNKLITQFAEASGMASPYSNGNAAGEITTVGMGKNGVITATYSNGQQVTVGQLALASIANPSSMVQVGDNNFLATAATSQATIGVGGTNGRGTIVGGALESSTTDMASQFTHLLGYERSYQAASRVITTTDQILQETVNLIHP